MKFDLALIGGTGIGHRLALLADGPVRIPTPEGQLRGHLARIGDRSVLIVERHSAGHKTPPHRVNYKAISLAMHQTGVRACFATAAVGSLRSEWRPGTRLVCSGFIDLSGRNLTLFDRVVRHTDFTEPMGGVSRETLLKADPEAKQGVYLCSNGPRYETPEEIRFYRNAGADVVGMTAASEAIVAREAGIDYACLAVVTNLACGIADGPLDHGEVADQMAESGQHVVEILLKACRLYPL